MIYYELEKIKDKEQFYKIKENKELNKIFLNIIKNKEIEYTDYIESYLKINNYNKWKKYVKKYRRQKMISNDIKKIKNIIRKRA